MYMIIEVEDGLTIVSRSAKQEPEAIAIRHGGVVADPGPYETYEEANDALLSLEGEEFDEIEATGRI
jgi:hypothetical protein